MAKNDGYFSNATDTRTTTLTRVSTMIAADKHANNPPVQSFTQHRYYVNVSERLISLLQLNIGYGCDCERKSVLRLTERTAVFVVKKEFGAGVRIRCRYLHSVELAHSQVTHSIG